MIADWLPTLVKGSVLTLGVGVIALVLSLVCGMIIALFRLSHSRILRSIGTAYTTIIRGIPELVLLLLIFYGGQQFINDWRFEWADARGIDINPIDFAPFWAGAIVYPNNGFFSVLPCHRWCAMHCRVSATTGW